MDKISSILPPSSRVTSVDLKSSGTARSGMPSYGRPQLQATGSQRRHIQEKLASPVNPNRDPHVDIVDKISKEFFIQKNEAPKSQLNVDRAAIYGADADLDPMTDTVIPQEDQMFGPVKENQGQEADDLDVPLAGGYLDVAV